MLWAITALFVLLSLVAETDATTSVQRAQSGNDNNAHCVASMASNAVFALAQMEASWRLAAQGLHPADGENPVGHKRKYPITVLSRGDEDGCLQYNIKEPPSRYPGGASFYATIEGDEIHVCAVKVFFDGNYTVECPRPQQPKACAVVTVFLEWEDFRAYHNGKNGGGAIASNSGGMRRELAEPLFREKYCVPGEAPAHTPHHTSLAGWVQKNSTGQKGPWAEWQSDGLVWKGATGRVQQPSANQSAQYRECFRGLNMVDILGASHLNYMGWCIVDEVLHYMGIDKPSRNTNPVPKDLLDKAQKQLKVHGRKNFYKPKEGRGDAAKFDFIKKCGGHLADCISELKDCDCYFEHMANGDLALRVCSHKVTSMATASAAIHLMLLNLPASNSSSLPWTEKNVIISMTGHW